MRTTTRSSMIHDERPHPIAAPPAPPGPVVSRSESTRPRSGRSWARAAAVVVVASTVLAGACSGTEDAGPPPPPPKLVIPERPIGSTPPTMALPPGYEAPDTRDVELSPITSPIGGEFPPAAEVAMAGGTSRLTGVITNGDAPVPGAVVRIERFVDDLVGRVDLTTGADGRYNAQGLPGGRYRLRAWQAPGLTNTKPVTLFLVAEAGSETVDLGLTGHNVVTFNTTGSSGRWRVKQGATVTVQLNQQYVDDEGIVRAGPMAGTTVTAQAGAGLALAEDGATTSGAGSAQFSVTCTEPGFHAVSVTAAGQSRTVSLGECLPETDPPPTVAEVPIGGGFTTERPTVVVIPAGTYVAQGPDAATCRVAFETYRNGLWVSGTAGTSLTLTEPGRNLRPAGASPGCLYRRVS